MDILENLDSRFRIDAHEPPASQAEIDALVEFSSIPVPDDYISIVRNMTEVEILVDGDSYIRIWSPSGCIEMNGANSVQDCIPHSLAIGDDEGGSALILMTGNRGFGLYLSSFGVLDASYAKYISGSLRELLVQGESAITW